jgi:hypothetical protein
VLTPTLETDEDLGVVTELPPLSARTGYLVRLTAQGAPFIDYTQPLTVWLDRGVPLPEMVAPLGGTVRYTAADPEPLTITSFERRFDVHPTPAVYFAAGEALLCGDEADWADVESIEVHYTPIAPRLTRLTDYLLVPDAAEPCLVAQAAAFAARRINGTDGFQLDVRGFLEDAVQAEAEYLSTLRLAKRGRRTTFREG